MSRAPISARPKLGECPERLADRGSSRSRAALRRHGRRRDTFCRTTRSWVFTTASSRNISPLDGLRPRESRGGGCPGARGAVALLGSVHLRVRDREVVPQVGRDSPAQVVRDAAVVRLTEGDDVLDVRRRGPIRPDVERQARSTACRPSRRSSSRVADWARASRCSADAKPGSHPCGLVGRIKRDGRACRGLASWRPAAARPMPDGISRRAMPAQGPAHGPGRS